MNNFFNFIFFLLNILLGKPKHPPIKNLREVKNDNLYFGSLTRGAVVSGNPGTGKTTWTAMQVIDYAKQYPDSPIFILDASGSLTNEIVELAYLEPPEMRDSLLRRFVLDIPGDDQLVIPQPFFSPDYGLTDEELVQRPVTILKELNSEKVELTPIMGIAITELAPQLFRLINVIRNKLGERWQLTEARQLLVKLEQLRLACKAYGQYAKGAKFYLENELLGDDIGPAERQRRMLALRNVLGVLDTRALTARYGAYRPTITPQYIIDNGLIYILSGEKLTNLEDAQAWVVWEAYNGLEAAVNKRIPHDPHDRPILLVIDEVYKLFKIKGLAEKLGQIATYYRSRKLMAVIIIQAYWQLDDILKEQIWSFGTQVTFALENFNDAYRYSKETEEYDPHKERLAAKREDGQPILDTDRGQYLVMANWLQNLKWRQMVMRRYLDERTKEPFLSFIDKTREKPTGTLPASIHQLKQELFRKYAVNISDVLRDINGRHLELKTGERPRIRKK
jgi:hypothetical protein